MPFVRTPFEMMENNYCSFRLANFQRDFSRICDYFLQSDFLTVCPTLKIQNGNQLVSTTALFIILILRVGMRLGIAIWDNLDSGTVAAVIASPDSWLTHMTSVRSVPYIKLSFNIECTHYLIRWSLNEKSSSTMYIVSCSKMCISMWGRTFVYFRSENVGTGGLPRIYLLLIACA